jgi:ABC-type uncharacterized transport system substrate-binding protein
MNRRDFITFIGPAAAFRPSSVRAQQTAMPVIGYLSGASPYPAVEFRQGLNDIGYVEGQNLAIEYRWAEGQYDRLPALAADLVSRKVDAIAALGVTVTLAAKAATSTIPIVFISADDPVERGLVASFARPGGNLTGFAHPDVELMPKRLELLSELVPQARVIALLVNPMAGSVVERIIAGVQEAARAKGLRLVSLKASSESEIETAFVSLHEQDAGALVVSVDPFFTSQREQLAALASRHAVPAIYHRSDYCTASGGLISYGVSFPALYRQMGGYAGKILKGAKPDDLPVQQPTIFELVVNLRTAKALGLTVPPSILARADEVIE